MLKNFLEKIRSEFQHKISTILLKKSKGNRINLKNELEKIENFTQKKLSIELDEIMKLTNLAENYDISELTDQCLARNKKKNFKYTK